MWGEINWDYLAIQDEAINQERRRNEETMQNNITITEEQICKAAEDLHWGDLENHTPEAITAAFKKWLTDHIEGVLEEPDWWVHRHDTKVFKAALPDLEKTA